MYLAKEKHIYKYSDIDKNLINSKELLNEDFIYIESNKEDENIKFKYYILRNKEEVNEFLQKYGGTNKTCNKNIGAIITSDYIIDESNAFITSHLKICNLIFLEDFILKKSIYVDIFENEYYVGFRNCIFNDISFYNLTFKTELYFKNCIFKDTLVFRKCEFEYGIAFKECDFCLKKDCKLENYINFDDSKFKDDVTFKECIFEIKMSFKNTIYEKKFEIIDSLFQKELDFYKATFQKELNFINITLNSLCNFTEATIKSFSRFKDIKLNDNSILNFSNSNFYEWVDLKLDYEEKVKGKIIFYRTNFHGKCYLDYEMLEKDKFKVFILDKDINIYESYLKNNIDSLNKANKWTLFYASQIYKENGKLEPYLCTYYLYKKYERLEKRELVKNMSFSKEKFFKQVDLIMSCIIEKTTKYFTSWKRNLISIGLVILCSFFIYCLFPNHLEYNESAIASKNTFSLLYDYYEKNQLNLLFSKFLEKNTWCKLGNILYFSIITFTTIGYGDISPQYIIKLIAGFEGLIGIFLSSAFLVSLSKKFLE
ncbi:potassium channel family protein [Tepidibacter formicigenes]|jgi:hypothetical protein|uniref:Ion channel n=1 Tax=Tepidibacter formicigenes DSM 15518 TaxID=1123349 RepID=A0A1M6JMN9_9FIRM|nr:potassium channel family protein [Tepidibacter formicigenes]SHJ47938.1 Ion channel [Tepidibacter formicigenes DSM 15518]